MSKNLLGRKVPLYGLLCLVKVDFPCRDFALQLFDRVNAPIQTFGSSLSSVQFQLCLASFHAWGCSGFPIVSLKIRPVLAETFYTTRRSCACSSNPLRVEPVSHRDNERPVIHGLETPNLLSFVFRSHVRNAFRLNFSK